MSVNGRYVWVVRWREFQHYTPERDRPPAWIKDYTKQILDERYLELTDRQRALLRDLRDVFAVTFGRVPDDTSVISRHRHRQTRREDLEALNHAGFIEVCSRETLERRLEEIYTSRGRPRAREEGEVEVEDPNPRRARESSAMPSDRTRTCRRCGAAVAPRASCTECGASPRIAGTNPRELTKPSAFDRAVAMTRNGGAAYSRPDFLAELAGFELTPDQRAEVEQLREQLAGDEPEPEPAPATLDELPELF